MESYSNIIIDALKKERFKSILEVGCGEGQIMSLIKMNYPDVQLFGFDISEDLINRLITENKLGIVFDATKKNWPISSKSFDIVFSSAVLILIKPQFTRGVIKEMIRIANKKIIFVELHSDKYKSVGEPLKEDDSRIVRNYVKLLKEFEEIKEIKTKEIPKEIWPGKSYSVSGYLIEAKLN